jgi:hypothetical protein
MQIFMKQIATLIFILFFATGTSFSQKAIFLHHSTGGGVWSDGNVEGWIENYNTNHGTHYSANERAYPDSPYPWENYPYDYWNLWVNNACNSDEPGIECMGSLTQKYNVIIYKHCFPGAGIEEDLGTPDVSSGRKSLENYKLQYRALREMMDGYPTNQFIVWTLAPLHRNATSTEDAARARQFVDWVNTVWLTEDGKPHPNIFIFDFYNIVAESNPNPAHGQVNCLKYEYEGDHNGSDSHPNYVANQVAGPLFAQFIVNCMEGNKAVLVSSIEIRSEGGMNTISTPGGTLQLTVTVLPENATNKNVTWSVISGEEFGSVSEAGLFTASNDGIAVVQASANDGSGINDTFSINVTNQKTWVDKLKKSGIKVIRDNGNGGYTVNFNNESTTTSLMIYSLSGELTWSGNVSSSLCKIPKQKPGVYILQIIHGEKRYSEKLVF